MYKYGDDICNLDNDCYSIIKRYSKVTNRHFYVVQPKNVTDDKTLKDQSIKARKYGGGYYSNYRGKDNFIFSTYKDAKSFADEVLAGVEILHAPQTACPQKRFRCVLCGSLYNPTWGLPEADIVFTIDDIPDDWCCPICGASKNNLIEEGSVKTCPEKALNNNNEINNMELHLALRTIVETDGQDIIKETRVVNILDDFKSFDSYPSTKYILRAIINEGYASKILSLGKWDTQTISLMHNFVVTTGFQTDMVNIVFQSIAFALGYINSINLSIKNNPSAIKKPQPSRIFDVSKLNLGHEEINRRGDKFEQQYKEECIEYINSIIEFKGNWKKLGAIFVPSCSYMVYGNTAGISINLEIDGKIKNILKGEYDDHIDINMVTYNQQGRILGKSYSRIDKDTFKNPYRVLTIGSLSEDCFYYIGNISKVVFYWEIG